MDKIISEFASGMGMILSLLLQKNPRDEDLRKYQEQFIVIQTQTPNYIIETAGPYIWKYREEILNDNVNYFLSKNLIKDYKFEDESTMENAQYYIDKIRMIWHIMTNEEKQLITNKFKHFLSLYASYLFHCKHLLY